MAEIIPFQKNATPTVFSVPDHVTRWERDATATLSRPVEYNLTRPQRSFRYPDFQLLAKDQRDNPIAVISEVLARRSGVGSEIFVSSADCFKHFISQFSAPRIKAGYMGSSLATHQNERIEWKKFERDPELWSDFDLAGLDVFVLSNPHAVDGFYFPKEFYFKLYQTLRAKAPELKIYSEESLDLAVYTVLEAGSLKSFLQSDSLLYVEDSIYPVATPAGPLTAWLHHQSFSKTPDATRLSEYEKDMSARALLCFEQKNSPTYSEFVRRKLAAKESLKVLSLYLNYGLTSHSLRVSTWPDAGFHIVADISPLLLALGMNSSREWCLQLAENQQILVNPGDLFGQNHSVQICFAASTPYVDRIGPELRDAIVLPRLL